LIFPGVGYTKTKRGGFKMSKDPKDKIDQEDKDEKVVDYNPDDVEFGEDLTGVEQQRKKNYEKNRDLNPDDFE
jgi:hypothetical protein